jgi:Cof subfamily protein (haloacid dehalogenase superfamily)
VDLQALKAIGQKIRVIVCDLDQTLLNSHKRISSANLEAIRAAQAQGIFVTLCSGRIFTMLETYARELAIDGPVISTNGAAIVNARDYILLAAHPMARDVALSILDQALNRGYDTAALTEEACYFSANSIRVERFQQYNRIAGEQGLKEIPILPMADSREAVSSSVLKILIQELQPGDLAHATQMLQSIDGISITSSEPGLLDVMKAGVDKGSGVAELRAILAVEREQVCVFGDYLNDLPMFAEAGFPIAMGNAHAELKARALVVTDGYEEDGIARALYEYIL